jgi:hypothetical protein
MIALLIVPVALAYIASVLYLLRRDYIRQERARLANAAGPGWHWGYMCDAINPQAHYVGIEYLSGKDGVGPHRSVYEYGRCDCDGRSFQFILWPLIGLLWLVIVGVEKAIRPEVTPGPSVSKMEKRIAELEEELGIKCD